MRGRGRYSIAQAGPKAKKRCVGGREVINRFSECSSKREVKVVERERSRHVEPEWMTEYERRGREVVK